ncbi:MAG: CvpA family protein [Lachnospiraceae bacterium]|jgi:hypothetical protein|nr:CvpA family protein [Lachnospiraceae bacterium]
MEITEFLQEHWVSVLMASYLIGMMLYGHRRGFLHLAVSMAALVLSLFVVHFAMPQVRTFVKENTGIHQRLQETMIRAAGLDGLSDEKLVLPAQQREAIENSKLPEIIKSVLVENNNEEIYNMLGVKAFADYISTYLADRIINTLVFFIMFSLVYIGIRILIHALDLIARLPVLCGMNQIAGAALGLVLGLVYFWIFCLVLNLFIGTEWGQYLLDQIEATSWLSFLYHYNLLSKLVMGIFWNLFL